jgi:branched-chain amino acid transport system substrate-binding protein
VRKVRNPAAAVVATLLCLSLGLLPGCGSRVDHAEIVAGAGGRTVSLDQASITALKQSPASTTGTVPSKNLPAPDRQAMAAATVPPAPAAGTPRAQRTRPATTTGRTTTAASPGPAAGSRPVAAAAGGQVGAACTDPLTPIPLGQVGTFSGVVGAITAGDRAALAVWAQDVNARGGLACHPVRLYVEDDGGDPSRVAAAVKDLAGRHHVAALVGNAIGFTAGGFVPALADVRIPAVGGLLIAPEWFTSPWMFPQGAGIYDQVNAITQAGVAAGHRKLGLLYCVEVPACGSVDQKLFHDGGAKAAGADPVYDSPISITQPDFTAQCLNARKAGVDLLGLAMDGAAMTRLARSCAAIGYRPLLGTGAVTFSLRNTEDPNLRAFGMVVGSPVAPWMALDTPAARAFHETLARYAPDLHPDGEAMLGWTSGKLLEAAVDRLSTTERTADLTTALILTGLGRIHEETLGGLTGPLSFTPGEQHAVSNGCNYFERLGPDGWTSPTGSRPVCTKN